MTSKHTFGSVDASPSKAFFVGMLTRDITLDDAILDLLDNCVDGIIRTRGRRKPGSKPYSGKEAEINFDENTFSIHDNCGGIPWDLHEYAFRMGRPPGRKDDGLQTVGVYGIGMKRAIFKIGSDCLIQTQHKSESYEIEISDDWVHDESTWELHAEQNPSQMDEDGTTIVIGTISDRISEQFKRKEFEDNLIKKIESHYAIIIEKGFSVKVNGKTVEPRPISFHFSPTSKSGIRPYIFESNVNGVDVFLTVGLREGIPSEEKVSESQDETRYSRDLAGWTVICNDRVVLYCNKDEQTGWGEASVPKYHNQFIAVSGIVEFRATDASLLPTTTTKRGIDHSSSLYAQVKNRMREGTKIFTDYTNDWKSREAEAKEHVQKAPRKTFREIKRESKHLKLTSVRTGLKGKQFKPDLPKPVSSNGTKRIAFRKPIDEIEFVSNYLFGDSDESPSKVGEECFDRVLKEAQ